MTGNLKEDLTLDIINEAVRAMKEYGIKPLVCKKCGRSYYVIYPPSTITINQDREECEHEFFSKP